MKRLIISLFSVLNSILLFSQQWAMDEAADDAQLTDPLTIDVIISALFFIGLSVYLYKYAKVLKTYEKNKFLKHLKVVTISTLVVGAVFFSAIELYYSNKRDSREKQANERLREISNKVDMYVDIYDRIPLEIDRISPDDFYTKGNDIYGSQLYYPNEPHVEDGVKVYSCYRVFSGPKLEVAYAKAARDLLSRDYETPGLYNIWISPYRIRYYREFSDPERDITSTFPYFVDRFLKKYDYQIVDGILESITEELGNEYFKIQGIDMDISPDELWEKQRKMFDNQSIDQMNVYEYESLNFGDFEIMYCITLTSKLGIVEKMVPNGIKNKREDFEYISEVEKNRSLNKFLRIYLLFMMLLIATFTLGWPRN